MGIFKKKCIVCEKKIEKDCIEKHDQNFCSEECLQKFEKQMKELDELSLDDCC